MRYFLCLVAATVIFCAPALLNGAPFLYWDTAAYLSRPEVALRMLMEQSGYSLDSIFDSVERQGTGEFSPTAGGEPPTVIGGRSIYYGMLVYASYHFGHLWSLIVLQALLTSAVLGALYFRVLGWRSVPGFLALAAALAFLTPSGFFVGLVMPDFLAPLLILSAAMLMAAWTTLPRNDRLLLAGAVLLAAASHTSHLAVGVLMLGLAAVARLLPAARPRLAMPGMATVAGAIALALVANVLFVAMVTRVTGHPPITRPHVTAHLTDNGPGVAYLEATCPGSGFALCDYRDRLPMDWIAFMFEHDPAAGVFGSADPAMQRALSAEQTRFVLAVVAHDPAGVAGFALDAAVRQLGLLAIHEVPLGASPGRMQTLQEDFPARMVTETAASRAFSQPRILVALTWVTYATAILAAGMLLPIAWQIRGDRPLATAGGAVLCLILAGLILNAAVCGILASPYPRFQARVVWLLPLAAIIAAGLLRQRRNARPDLADTPSMRSLSPSQGPTL